MSEDLKQSLGKVLPSQGKKCFFFAYGTDKCKDGLFPSVPSRPLIDPQRHTLPH